MTDETPAPTKPPAKKRRGSAGQSAQARARAEAKQIHGEGGRYAGKLTRKVIGDLEKALASGAPPADAAPMAGISRASFQEWMKLSRLPGAPPLLVELAQAVDRAMSSVHVSVAASLMKAARDGDVKALQFILERRFPHAWGRQDRVEVGNADGDPFRVLVGSFDMSRLAGMSTEDLQTLRALLAKTSSEEADVIDLDSRRQLGA